MNEMVPEIVRIGAGNARIKCLTPQRVEYFDEAGQECTIELEECARNRVQYGQSWREDGPRRRDFRVVAKCGFVDDPPWIEFMNERRTRFEFWSLEEPKH